MEERKEKYKGPFLIVHKGLEYRHTMVWHHLIYDPIEKYFNIKGISVTDINGNELKLEDIEINN